MSNNIYDILKTMQNLEAPKQTLTESKMSTVKELHNEGKKKKPTNKGSIAEAVNKVESQLNEKYMGFKKLGEDALDFLRSPEGIAKNRAAQARAEQNFADRSAKHFAGQIGDQYHDQLMKNSPSYADEYRSRAKDTPYDKLDKLSKTLQAKHDPMGGPTDIDYEKIKKNPMATRAGEQGTDWRPFGPGPRDSFGSDEFGRPVKEGEMEESGLQAYLGKKKYGKEGMAALQKAGREGASKEKMAQIRARHDKMDEGNYNEDMLSPKDKEFAALAEPKDKITYADKIAGAKKGVKKEGNKFSGNLMKARAKGLKRADLDGDGDMEPVREEENKYMNKDGTFKNPRTDAARERQRAEIEQTQKTSDENWMGPKDKAPKYRPSEYTQGKYSQEISKAMDQDREERDAARSTLNKIGNYGSRLVFGKDIPVNEGQEEMQSAFAVVDEEHQAAIQKMQIGKLLMREGWEEMQKYLEKKRGPESKGGAGKKAGTRYGGSAQKDDDEETDGEGQPAVKKKGRPKGTGGGAKFSFKLPKDKK